MKMEVKVKATQLWSTLCDPMGYTVHGIPQARILEWATIPISRWSSQPRDQTQVSCIADRFFTSWATREPHENGKQKQFSSQDKRIIILSLDVSLFLYSRPPFQFLTFPISSRVVFSLNSSLKWRITGSGIKTETHQDHEPCVSGLKSLGSVPFSRPQSANSFSYTTTSLPHSICVFLATCRLRNMAFVWLYLEKM